MTGMRELTIDELEAVSGGDESVISQLGAVAEAALQAITTPPSTMQRLYNKVTGK